MTNEVWRPCPRTLDIYEISSLGNIRRTIPSQQTRKGRNLSHAKNKKGYHYVCMSLPTGCITGWVHRLICEAFNGPPPSARHQAAHRDDDKDNNSAGNLYWATPLENHRDREKNGRALIGSRSSGAKLTEMDIPKIRAMRESGMLNREIGHLFGVAPHTVSQIVTGKHWKHVA